MMFQEPLLLACAAYTISAAMPGPATLLIATNSMRDGKHAGMATALGVMCGSITTGLLAASGVTAALTMMSHWTEALQLAGGIYLVWLSISAIRSALTDKRRSRKRRRGTDRANKAFGRGMLVHVTNPIALLSWMTTVAIGTSSASVPWFAFVVVAACWCIGFSIFSGYAILFAKPKAVEFYLRSQRLVYGLSAIIFGTAGFVLLSMTH